MTRKHFETLARILRDSAADARKIHQGEYLRGRIDALAEMASDLADSLESENPRFDRARFLSAAGFGETTGGVYIQG